MMREKMKEEGLGADAQSREGAVDTEPKLLFEIEAWWGDASTTMIRYVEARNIHEALAVVPEETEVIRIVMLGGLYKP